MDLSEKLQELTDLLSGFLFGTVHAEELQKFVWEVIDYFSITQKSDLPPEAEFERAFWYVVWAVQHLVTDDHLSDGSAQKELEDSLAYLKGDRSLPADYIGRRP